LVSSTRIPIFPSSRNTWLRSVPFYFSFCTRFVDHEALGVVGLVAGIRGALDTSTFLEDLFQGDEEAHSLVLKYKIIHVCLHRWLDKPDEMIVAGNDPVSPVSVEIKVLVVGHLTEIDRWTRGIDKCLETQGLNDVPVYESLADGQSMPSYVVPERFKET
jgi:hypothetical protein